MNLISRLPRVAVSQVRVLRLLALFAVALLLSALIPPLQSPDEPDHLKRASLLTHGVILLSTPPGESSGGMIDSGLAAFLGHYSYLQFQPTQKVTRDITMQAEDIRWSGRRVFSAAPGTGYYFPAIYLPQALGLFAGEHLGWTVAQSYRLARVLTMLSVAALLLLAFGLVRPSLFTVALLILPMTLFQFASASIDGVATALTIFVLSVSLHVYRTRMLRRPTLIFVTLALFVLLTSRMHLLPLVLTLPYLYRVTREKWVLPAFGGLILATGLWFALALGQTTDLRVVMPARPVQVALTYLQHPADLVSIYVRTFSDQVTVEFYRDTFIGVLGWLDTRFFAGFYPTAFLLLLLIGVLSVSVEQTRSRGWLTAGMLGVAVTSGLLVMFLMLVTWTPGIAVIQGVQGRYFLLPMLVVAYATHDESGTYRASLYRKLAVTLLGIMGLLITYHLPRILIERYFMQ